MPGPQSDSSATRRSTCRANATLFSGLGPDGAKGGHDEFTDLVKKYEKKSAYTFVFDGQLGTLDHALASKSLKSQVKGLTVFHINADESDILDYDTSFKKPAQDALYEALPYRVSDHDPVIIGLKLKKDKKAKKGK
ncbi:MAG: hypothetical protein IH941_06785 [Acidobacteria bacterium]|nr:hypothetical protein [Acidobacteriota bacterium]